MARKKKTEEIINIPQVEETEKKTDNRVFKLKLYRSQLIKLSVIDLFMSYLLNNIFRMGPDSLNVSIEGETYIVKDLRNALSKLQSGIDLMMGRKDETSFSYTHQFLSNLEYTLDMQRLASLITEYIRKFYRTDNVCIVIEIPQVWNNKATAESLIGVYILQDYFECVQIEYY